VYNYVANVSDGSSTIATIAPTGVNVSQPNTTVSSGYLAYTPNDATAAAAIELIQSGTSSPAIGQAINDAYNAISAAPTQEAILATAAANAAAAAAALAAQQPASTPVIEPVPTTPQTQTPAGPSEAPGDPDIPDELAIVTFGLSGGGLNGCMTASGSPEPYGCNPAKVFPGQDTSASLVKPQSPYGWQFIGVIGVPFGRVLIDTTVDSRRYEYSVKIQGAQPSLITGSVSSTGIPGVPSFVRPYSFNFASVLGSLGARHVLPIGLFVAQSDGNANIDVVGDLATIYKGMQGQGAGVMELVTPDMGTGAVIEPFKIFTFRRLRPFSPTSS
jgi:hypothetical protein